MVSPPVKTYSSRSRPLSAGFADRLINMKRIATRTWGDLRRIDRSPRCAPPLVLWAALGWVAVLWVGCEKKQVAAPPPPVVQVLEVIATNAPLFTEIIGQLDSPQNVEVRARV